MKKQSLLTLLCKQFPNFNKEQLYAKILCGQVRSAAGLMRDSKILIPENTELELLKPRRFVSRGGEKLQHAIEVFASYGLSVSGAIVLDAGASSGGFTDCLLQNACSQVYAVDSGKNQLDFKLRSNSKVHCFEGCKIQDFLFDSLPQLIRSDKLNPPDWVVMDIAFRSILDLIPQALAACQRHYGVFLCKPQFEWQAFCAAQAQSPEIEFTGVLPDRVASEVFSWFCQELKQAQVELVHSCISPLRGKELGNREYLLFLRTADK